MAGKAGVKKRAKISQYTKVVMITLPTKLRSKIERRIGFRMSMSEFIRNAVHDYIENEYTEIEEIFERKPVAMTIRMTENEYKDMSKRARVLGASVAELIRTAIIFALKV